MPDLHTTNVLLGIMAAASIIEALAVIGLAVGGFIAYREVMQLGANLEARQIAPLREKVDAILLDVKAVTARVSQQSERVDHAISGTMDRVDETAGRVRSSVRDKVAQAVGVVRGVRAILISILHNGSRPKPSATAAGRA
jgi:hypothetical protein